MFPNLRALEIHNCGLREITRQDLTGLSGLEYLRLSGNSLTFIPNDLLVDMPKLGQIDFSSNTIRKVSSKFLEPIKSSLFNANFYNNPSISEDFVLGDDFDAFMKKLDSCKLPPDESPLKVAIKQKISDARLKKEAEFFANEKFSDFTLKACDKEYKVHKFILAAQSSVFENLFSAEEVEGVKIFENLATISKDTFEDFLFYFYNGSEIRNKVISMELFKLAAEFDVSDLKSQCEEIIFNQLNEENVIEVYNLGSQHGSDNLKRAAFEEIQKIIPSIQDELIDDKEHLNKLFAAKREYDALVQASKTKKS